MRSGAPPALVPLRAAAVAAAAGLLLAWTAPAPGADLVQADAYHLATNQALAASAWIAAGSILIEGSAANDLFLMAQERLLWTNPVPSGTIMLAGALSNDVWAMGKDIVVGGSIADHARLLAAQGTLRVEGTIGNEALLWGRTVYIQSNAVLNRGGTLYGEEVIVQGACGGPLAVRAASATLAGRFDGDVSVEADEIVLLAGTAIAGNLTYTSPRDLTPGDGVSVAGDLVRLPSPAPSPWDGLIWQLWLFAGSVLTGALFLKVFPAPFGRAADLVGTAGWKCLLAGMLTVSLLIAAGLLAAVSVVGLPLAATLAVSGGLLAYLAKIAVALAAGGWALRRALGRTKPGMTGLTLGLVFLYVGTNVPGMIGSLVWLGVTMMGMGGLMLALLAHSPWARLFALAPPAGAGDGPPPLPGATAGRDP